jgi:hypothetical protein
MDFYHHELPPFDRPWPWPPGYWTGDVDMTSKLEGILEVVLLTTPRDGGPAPPDASDLLGPRPALGWC